MSIFWFAANRRFKLNVDDRVVPTTRSQIIRLLPSHQLSGFLFCSHASIRRWQITTQAVSSFPKYWELPEDRQNGNAHKKALYNEDRQLATGRECLLKTANSPAPTPLPQELTKPTAPWPEPKITGNPPFGTDHVPSRYEAEWKALLAGCPPWATDAQWAETIFSCRDLFGEWGAELLRLNWPAKDIFDRWHGLAWFLRGQHVTAIGARHAFLEDGRIFERTGR
jgi:hypothetical protein